MRYFLLKIGRGNCHATKWLAGRNELGVPAAVIFFDNHPEAAYRAGTPDLDPQAVAFYESGQPANWANTRMVVIEESRLWVLRPAGKVRFLPPKPEETEGSPILRKAMPVEVLAKQDLRAVPAVLAGLPANQYLTRGTFRQINHWGNLKAIDSVLTRFGNIPLDRTLEHWQPADQNPAQLLECLGATGLETLVARVLEAAGCFVPARTGGSLRDIDLFAHNDGVKDVVLDNPPYGCVRVPAGACHTIQVKTWPSGPDRFKATTVNHLIGLDVEGPDALNADWLFAVVLRFPRVSRWLRRSLDWLPTDFVQGFQPHP